jgi:hypothetical protein
MLLKFIISLTLKIQKGQVKCYIWYRIKLKISILMHFVQYKVDTEKSGKYCIQICTVKIINAQSHL